MSTEESIHMSAGLPGRRLAAVLWTAGLRRGITVPPRIQGRNATVGGIAGFQNASDIYNSYVSGTIGGSGSGIVGGITGK